MIVAPTPEIVLTPIGGAILIVVFLCSICAFHCKYNSVSESVDGSESDTDECSESIEDNDNNDSNEVTEVTEVIKVTEAIESYNELVRVVSLKDYGAEIMRNPDRIAKALSTDNDYSFLYNSNYIGLYHHIYVDNVVEILDSLASSRDDIRSKVHALMVSVMSHNFKYVSDNRDTVLHFIEHLSDEKYPCHYDDLYNTYLIYMPSNAYNEYEYEDYEEDVDFGEDTRSTTPHVQNNE